MSSPQGELNIGFREFRVASDDEKDGFAEEIGVEWNE